MYTHQLRHQLYDTYSLRRTTAEFLHPSSEVHPTSFVRFWKSISTSVRTRAKKQKTQILHDLRFLFYVV